MEIIVLEIVIILLLKPCEYVENFLKLFPKTEIILNIDNDHLDYFGSIENIVRSFSKYVTLIPDDGLLVVNWDDIYCRTIAKNTKAKQLLLVLKMKLLIS